jgi:hypothetical protein
MKKSILAIPVLAFICAIAVSVNPFKGTLISLSAVEKARTMLFDGDNKNFTTDDGNTFESYWVKEQNGCSNASKFNFVYLTGTATWNSYTEKYSVQKPIYEIKGMYPINKINQITVKSNITTYWTTLSMNFKRVGSASDSSVTINYTETTNQSSISTKIFNFDDIGVEYLQFSLAHHPTNGGSSDGMNATIFSVEIQYYC